MQQSFSQYFITNSPALLAQGSTVENLGVGQIGILDAKTHTAVTSPTYANVKALEVVWGTPDLGDLPLMAGVPNQNLYSKLIKGKKITGFSGKKAKRPKNQIVTVGFSGDTTDTDTLFANQGDVRRLYVKLTGAPIDKLYSKQGLIRQYAIDTNCWNSSTDCTTDCTSPDPVRMAKEIAAQINADKFVNRFIKASSIISCNPTYSPTTANCYRFDVSVFDTRDDIALGIVQAQYPNDKVTRVATNGALSVYEIIRSANTTPSAVSNAGFTLISDCATCPSGYTSTANGFFVYEVSRQDAGDATALTTVKSDYGISSTGETGVRLNYQYGQSNYILVSATALTVSGTDNLIALGTTRNSCVLATPSTYSWSLSETMLKYAKVFNITLSDTVCGTDRLAELQAAYPDLVITLPSSSGSCVHTYSTTIYSQCVSSGCSYDTLTWIKPSGYQGATWKEVVDDLSGSVCLTGVKIEVAFVNRITNECTFDYFPYDGDTIHVQVSQYEPDFNATPCTSEWKVKYIQGFEYPSGFGAYVRQLEKESLSYALKERSFDPVVREIEGYQFQTNAFTYYDEYTLSFGFDYKVGGWSESYSDSYKLHFFFPEGQGKNFESAMNTYLTSVGVLENPVVL